MNYLLAIAPMPIRSSGGSLTLEDYLLVVLGAVGLVIVVSAIVIFILRNKL